MQAYVRGRATHFHFFFQSINIPHFHSLLTQLSQHLSNLTHSLTHSSLFQNVSWRGSKSGYGAHNVCFRDQILAGIRAIQEQEQAEKQVSRPIHHWTSIHRVHGVAHQRPFEDYFADEPRWGPTVFLRRFRMRQELFLRIVQTLEVHDEYFQQRQDAARRVGLCYYGGHVRRVSSRRGYNWRESLAKFCAGMVDAFGVTY